MGDLLLRRSCGGAGQARWALAVSLLLASAASADVVRPPPRTCPPGHRPSTDHGGPYCSPPPPRTCPAGHVPRVVGRAAYCEPPPKVPCPAGSSWTSLSAEDTFCLAERTCETDACAADATCVPTGFCLSWTCFRCSMTRLVGVCRTDADCPKDVTCARQYRCDPKTKRAALGPGPGTPPPWSEAKLQVLPKHELADCAYQSCPAGFECLPLSLCLDQAALATPRPGITAVVGSCARGARCPEKSACSHRFRCVDPKVLKPSAPTSKGRAENRVGPAPKKKE